jgi:hypothetical protein
MMLCVWSKYYLQMTFTTPLDPKNVKIDTPTREICVCSDRFTEPYRSRHLDLLLGKLMDAS